MTGNAVATAERQALFVEAYLANGHNAKEAAITAGYSAKTAKQLGSRILGRPEVKAAIAKRTEKVLFDAQLTTERWAKEMACIGHFDPGELYDAAGNLIPIHQLPEHVRRAIASVEVATDKDGDVTRKVKIADKNTALANIGKHLGVFERDNYQKAEAIRVVIQLVG